MGDLSDSSQDSSEVGLISASHKETDPQRGKVIPQCWGGAGAEPGTCHQGEREVEGVQMGQREEWRTGGEVRGQEREGEMTESSTWKTDCRLHLFSSINQDSEYIFYLLLFSFFILFI